MPAERRQGEAIAEGLLIGKDGYICDSGEIVFEAQVPKPEQPRLFD
jgi:hypothetical protein